MDNMVLLVGDSRQDEDEDCACLHNPAGVPKQDHSVGWRVHVGAMR